MNTIGLLLAVIGFAASSVNVAQAADNPAVHNTATGLEAAVEGGGVLWRMNASSLHHRKAPVRAMDSGLFLSDQGLVLNAAGEVLARIHGAGVAHGPGPVLDSDCPHWIDLAEITPPPSGFSDGHAPLLMDSQGNAWVINTHIESGDYSLQVCQSDGHTGDWFPMQTISSSTRYVSQPEGAIDADDNITIVFRDINSGYHLYAIRYEPGNGWGALKKIHSSSVFFQAIEVASDEDGNIVVIFDPDLGSNTVWSIAYDASTDTWGSAAQISTSGYGTLLPSLAQNPSGDSMYVVYLVRSGGEAGLYAHKWDSESMTWGHAERLPGTDHALYEFAGPASRYPITVGEDGEASVLWQHIEEVNPDDYEFGVFVNRTVGGAWQPAQELLAPGVYDTDIANFAYIDSNDADVMAVCTRYESGANRFWAFRHSDGLGWWMPENPYTSTLNISTRVRGCFYQGARAMATLYGVQHGVNELTSLRYTGAGWLSDLLDIPGSYIAYYQDPIADAGEELLVFEAESGGNQGIKATWLRNLTGDVNCDGMVDIDDLFEVLANWGPCPHVPETCPADILGDGEVDINDVFDVLSNWS